MWHPPRSSKRSIGETQRDLVIDTGDCPLHTLDADECKIKAHIIDQASHLGPFVTAFVQSLWTDGVLSTAEHAARLMRLASTYDPVRLEAACRRALFYRKIDYPTVARILRDHLEALPLNPYADINGQLTFFPMDRLEECGV